MLELSAEHCQCSEIFCILRHYVTLPFDVSPFTNFSKLTSVVNVILFKNALGHNYNVATVTCISGVDLLSFFSLVTVLRTIIGTHIPTIPQVVYDSDIKYFTKLL